MTISGSLISLAPFVSHVVIGGTTSFLTTPTTNPETGPIITVNNQPVVANSALQYVVGSQNLVPNGPPITISDTPMTLAP